MSDTDDDKSPDTGRGLNTTFRQYLAEARRLRSELRWLQQSDTAAGNEANKKLDEEILRHLKAAEEIIQGLRFRRNGGAIFIGSGMSRVHFAEELMLRRGDAAYVVGKLPKVHADVQNHLDPKDEQRRKFESLVRCGNLEPRDLDEHLREFIVDVSTAAHRAYRREYARLRSFRITLITVSVVLFTIAVAMGLWGIAQPPSLALCFYPVDQGKVVCPINEGPFVAQQPAAGASTTGANGTPPAAQAGEQRDIDQVYQETSTPWDMPLILFIGLVSAAVAGAPSLRRAKGTATPYGLTVALGLMKLPTGALTAVLGLMLMRGGFVPGLSALDTSSQILAWAVVFGASQQLLTRLVDQQGAALIDQVGPTPSSEKTTTT